MLRQLNSYVLCKNGIDICLMVIYSFVCYTTVKYFSEMVFTSRWPIVHVGHPFYNLPV